MIEETLRNDRSRAVAVHLYDKWVRERQKRPDIRSTDDPKQLKHVERENFTSQLVKPRQGHLRDLKEAAASTTFADQVALLVHMELPALEMSTLLHRLTRQLAADPKSPYFSPENMADNCGCGCGCGCAAMKDLSYEERLVSHHQTKPYSIDPFNELGTKQQVRDSLLAQEFLESFEGLSRSIAARVNQRYFAMAKDFAAE